MSNSILDNPTVLNTRRNHALEHATLHMLARKYPKQTMGGHSNPTGFFIFGDFSTEEVRAAVDEALGRLRGGERELAIHPGCGTNLATTAFFSWSLAWASMRGARSTFTRVMRIPLAVALAGAGFALSQPLGPFLQRHVTTEGDPGPLQISSVTPVMGGRLKTHRVSTIGV
jgi:hypothetical protein